MTTERRRLGQFKSPSGEVIDFAVDEDLTLHVLGTLPDGWTIAWERDGR